MNKKLFLMATLALCLAVSVVSFATTTTQEQAPVLSPSKVTINDVEHQIYLQWIDLTDPTVRVDLSLADDKIGAVDTLENLSQAKGEDEEVLASINGSFFNMRPDSQPVSTLITNGDIQHIMHTGSVVGFNGDNEMKIEKLGIQIEGSINDQWEWPYSWSAWNINHLFDSKSAIMIFNNHYTGKFPAAPVYAVAVEHNAVIGIHSSIPKIPKNGYIIVTRNSNITHLFKVGDKVDFRLRTFERDENQNLTKVVVPFKDIRTALGAGPTLIKDGIKVLNPKSEGFKVSKLSTTRAKRSMIGTDASGKMAMVVSVNPITLDQLADIALKLGLKQAINLDGGGSSGMTVKGKYAVKPSRKISNAVVIKKLKSQPIRIALNDTELFFDVTPYIESKRTMVPLRRILEMLGCQVRWINETRQIEVNRYGTTLKFKTGEKEVIVNEKSYMMDVPLVIKKNRSFVSVRFLTEFFGGKVAWDNAKKQVSLSLPTVEEYYHIAEALYKREDYQVALDYYDKVLKMHPNHVSALKRTAYIYDTVIGDHRMALDYFKRALKIFDEDSDTYIMLGNAYRALDAIIEAIDAYEKAIKIKPKSEEAYYGMAKSYENINIEKAKYYYQWLVDNADSMAYKKEASAYLERNK